MKPASYDDVIQEAAGLLDPDEWQDNAEYLRGMCELIARAFPVEDLDTEARATEVRYDIGIVVQA